MDCTYSPMDDANPHAVTSVGATTHTYDNDGNLTAAGSNTYSFDWRNHLASSVVSGVTTNYNYDENDRRTRVDDGTTVYHYPNDLYQTDSVSGCRPSMCL